MANTNESSQPVELEDQCEDLPRAPVETVVQSICVTLIRVSLITVVQNDDILAGGDAVRSTSNIRNDVTRDGSNATGTTANRVNFEARSTATFSNSTSWSAATHLTPQSYKTA